jgi:hypothetical protein
MFVVQAKDVNVTEPIFFVADTLAHSAAPIVTNKPVYDTGTWLIHSSFSTTGLLTALHTILVWLMHFWTGTFRQDLVTAFKRY